MTALAIAPIARATILPRETITVHAIQTGMNAGQATLLDDAETLDEAVQCGALRTAHKGHFMVCVTNMRTGSSLLKFYAVKRKSKAVARYSEYRTRAIHDTYAEHLFDLAGGAIGAGS